MKNFKRDFLGKNSNKRRRIVKGGPDANLLFIDILQDYPMLVKAEESQKSSQSQSSTSSTKSWLDVTVPKPKSKFRKMFRKLNARYKRHKTDRIYRQCLIAAEELGCSPTELIAYLGCRANYLTDKKVANAFKALGENEFIGDMSLDRALYMKVRYDFTKRDWIDFRLDFQNIMMPTDGELRSYMKTLLDDEDLIPFHKGWRIEVCTSARKTLERMEEKVRSIWAL